MDPDEQERHDAYLWARFTVALADSAIPDVEQASGDVRFDRAGTLSMIVKSRSRGFVTVGTIDHAELAAGVAAVDDDLLTAFRQHVLEAKAHAADPLAEYARSLEAKRQAPLDAKRKKSDERQSTALAMHAAGRSVAYIARELKVDRRTVQRYLADAKSATHRETPP
jgi:DNA-binding NarL/FixJ family response regulator